VGQLSPIIAALPRWRRVCYTSLRIDGHSLLKPCPLRQRAMGVKAGGLLSRAGGSRFEFLMPLLLPTEQVAAEGLFQGLQSGAIGSFGQFVFIL